MGTRSGNNYMLLTPGYTWDNNFEVKFSRFGFCGVSQTDGVWSYTYQAELPQTIAKTSSNAPAQPASAGSVVKTAKTAPKVVVSKKAKAGKPDARRFLETAGKLQKR